MTTVHKKKKTVHFVRLLRLYILQDIASKAVSVLPLYHRDVNIERLEDICSMFLLLFFVVFLEVKTGLSACYEVDLPAS